jgi:hypothetical protein
MTRHRMISLIGIALLAAAGGGYYLWQDRGPAPAPAAPPAAAVGPQIDNPLPPAPSTLLPALADSDAPLGAELASVFHAPQLPELFYPTGLVHRFVATIDNLPREQVAADVRMLRPPVGALAVNGQEPSLSIAPENSARYARYLGLLATLDVAQAVAVYRKFYPLAQQAYEDLGYPGHYFNDRVVVVIDHLLATPQVDDPIPLIHPNVMYKFADPRIEARSAGQKALIRIGRDNAAQVKAKLREIRAQIATGPSA